VELLLLIVPTGKVPCEDMWMTKTNAKGGESGYSRTSSATGAIHIDNDKSQLDRYKQDPEGTTG